MAPRSRGRPRRRGCHYNPAARARGSGGPNLALRQSSGAFLLLQRSLVNRHKKTVLPVLLQRQQLADSLAKHLSLLGLERRSRPAQSLDEYLAASYAPTAATEASEAPAAAQPEAPSGSTAECEEDK
jgi:hypothetical protein